MLALDAIGSIAPEGKVDADAELLEMNDVAAEMLEAETEAAEEDIEASNGMGVRVAVARGVLVSHEKLLLVSAAECCAETGSLSPSSISLVLRWGASFGTVEAGKTKSGSSSARRFSTHSIAGIRLPARRASSVSRSSTTSSATWASSWVRFASYKMIVHLIKREVVNMKGNKSPVSMSERHPNSPV